MTPATNSDEFPAWVADERAKREALKTDYQAIFGTISRILFEEDPMGINFDDNTDEYDPEAGTIIPRLASCTSTADTQRVVHEEFVRWFSAADAGALERYDRVAARVWEAWQQRSHP